MSDQATERAYDQLKGKQKAFVDAYVGTTNGNAAKAARLAGYSEKTARQIGQENLTKPDIRQAIDERYKELAMGKEETIHRLSAIARATIDDAYETVTYTHVENVTGLLFNPGGEDEEVDVEHRVQVVDKKITLNKLIETGLIHYVKSIKETKYGTNYELQDTVAALDRIARFHRLYAEEGASQEVVIKVVQGVDMEKV